MSKRYAISPIIGTGTQADPFRASVADVSGANSVAIIPTTPNGHPKYRFALTAVCAATFTDVLTVTNLYALPDYSLDARMDGMASQTRTDMVQSVQAYDLDGNGLHLEATNADSSSYRDLLNSLGRQFDATFDVDHFGAAEVSQ